MPVSDAVINEFKKETLRIAAEPAPLHHACFSCELSIICDEDGRGRRGDRGRRMTARLPCGPETFRPPMTVGGVPVQRSAHPALLRHRDRVPSQGTLLSSLLSVGRDEACCRKSTTGGVHREPLTGEVLRVMIVD
jgi:hypothetical protein